MKPALTSKLRPFLSLEIRALMDARAAYHLHLAHLDNVFATAVGRYLIRDDDPDSKRHDRRKSRDSGGARTLANSRPRPWSWPCVLVFVKHWYSPEEVAAHRLD